MTRRLNVLLLIMIFLGIFVGRDYWLRYYGNKITVETDHYIISSTATQPQTILVGAAAESLYAAYTAFFKDMINFNGNALKLKLVLYKDKQEFTVHNKSSVWAEAFYQTPYCYAYYSEGEYSPYHWMIHEGTHQLNNEIAHFKVQKWMDEGLATYFGTSKVKDGKLLPGQIDINAYPIWWLPSLLLTGNLKTDIKNDKIITLRSLITGNGGPDINKRFNLYYMQYWSLTHFLLHFNGGQYAAGYRKVIAEGGSLESFVKNIGPIDRVQNEWYEYFQQKILEVNTIKKEITTTHNKLLIPLWNNAGLAVAPAGQS